MILSRINRTTMNLLLKVSTFLSRYIYVYDCHSEFLATLDLPPKI